jgi:YYY domain-containing protein
MIELFEMWALIEVLGLLLLPLTVTVCHNLPDRGWAFSKTLGLAIFSFVVWLPLMYVSALPYSRPFILAVAVVLAVLGLVGFWRLRLELFKFIRLNVAYILASEVVFLGMVFVLGWLRSYGPEIRSYEMFMDEGFIAAIMRSPHFPPNDMWFAGYSINYYYYAHYTIATAAKLLGQSPSIAFNTGICIFFGLTAVNLFGVTCNIVSWARYLRVSVRQEAAIERPDKVHPSLLRSIPFGFLSMVMGLVLGNLAATQQWWQNHGNVSAYDWFAPSRVIDKTINEFPAFSFLLSCFHAHVLALAFTILAIGLAFNLFLEFDGKGLFVFGQGWRLGFTLVVTALVISGLFVMNGWDYPTYMGLALVCIGLQQWLAYGARFHPHLLLDVLMPCISLVALSFLLYVPFYLHFISPSQGIGIVAASERSPLANVLLIYGLFAFVFLSLLLASVLKHPLFSFFHLVGLTEDEAALSRWSRIGMIAIGCFVLLCLVLLFVMPNSITFLLATTIALAGVVLLIYNIGDRAHAFTLLLGALAFALIAGCEVFFLRDVFAGNYPRMNTVFKFYFQAWALLAIASGAGTFFILESLRPMASMSANTRIWQRLSGIGWGVVLVAFVIAACAYPVAAPYVRYAHVDPLTQRSYLVRTDSLDGLTYLKTDAANPGDYDAIRWLNANVQGDPVIVEPIGVDSNNNVGGDYSNYSRISAFTGLPTLMGWVGHEYQWRVRWLDNEANNAEFQRRIGDVDTIYTSTDPNAVLSVMKHYNAQYIYVGPLEYARYPKVDLHRFSTFMRVVYNAEGVTIYQVKK